MHAWKYPAHEQRLAELAREAGFTQVSASHAVSPLLRLVPRGDTTVVDAYLSPILRRYVDQVAGELAGTRLYFMQSNGGLAEAHAFQGKDAILSGPAGGIVGAARTAAMAGLDRIIGFDMGGTSTDVALYAGEFERAFETEVAGVRHARADDGDQHRRGRRRLDPAFRRRALARRPGLRRRRSRPRLLPPRRPADRDRRQCLRRQDPAGAFPGDLRAGRRPAARCRRRARESSPHLADEIAAATGTRRDRRSRSRRASCSIAVANMANAIKQVSVQKGHDATRFALQCFGGAGGQHACLVADALGMETVFIHPFAGVLSAYGMGLADQTVMREQAVEVPLEPETMPDLGTWRTGWRWTPRRRWPARAPMPARIVTSRVAASALRRHRGRADRCVARRTRRWSRISPRRTAPASASPRRSAPLVVEAVAVEAIAAGEAVQRDADLARAGRARRTPIDTRARCSPAARRTLRRCSTAPACWPATASPGRR